MAPGTRSVADPRPADWSEVHQFYARQTHLRESGRIDDWADTFSDGAVMVQHTTPGRLRPGELAELRGRDAIASSARVAALRRAGGGTVRRFWITTVDVSPEGPDRVWTRYGVGLLGTSADTGTVILLSATGLDLLVREGGTLRVERRTLFHDDIPS